jgi:uncharacterized membrane protein
MFDVSKASDTEVATAAGQTIRYTISITNTGTVDLTNLQVWRKKKGGKKSSEFLSRLLIL